MIWPIDRLRFVRLLGCGAKLFAVGSKGVVAIAEDASACGADEGAAGVPEEWIVICARGHEHCDACPCLDAVRQASARGEARDEREPLAVRLRQFNADAGNGYRKGAEVRNLEAETAFICCDVELRGKADFDAIVVQRAPGVDDPECGPEQGQGEGDQLASVGGHGANESTSAVAHGNAQSLRGGKP